MIFWKNTNLNWLDGVRPSAPLVRAKPGDTAKYQQKHYPILPSMRSNSNYTRITDLKKTKTTPSQSGYVEKKRMETPSLPHNPGRIKNTSSQTGLNKKTQLKLSQELTYPPPPKEAIPKGHFIFQPSILWGYVSFLEGKSIHPKKCPVLLMDQKSQGQPPLGWC